jgi:uncharacterized protein YqjF (DUF2071 family)
MQWDASHRPWPLPRRPWVMGMRWHDLLFAHWPVPVEALRPLIPAALQVDTFQGQAWLGVVPFRMSAVRPRLCPSLPRLSAFQELNVRTYVTADDKPGVWFFSLDAANAAAVRMARSTYHLPYFDASMLLAETEGWLDYTSRRTHRGASPAEFTGRYRPIGDVFRSQPGTVEHWLTERYCLYAARGQTVYRGDIHHLRWPLQPAEAAIERNTMADWLGLSIIGSPPLLHFARFLDVVAWAPERVG